MMGAVEKAFEVVDKPVYMVEERQVILFEKRFYLLQCVVFRCDHLVRRPPITRIHARVTGFSLYHLVNCLHRFEPSANCGFEPEVADVANVINNAVPVFVRQRRNPTRWLSQPTACAGWQVVV